MSNSNETTSNEVKTDTPKVAEAPKEKMVNVTMKVKASERDRLQKAYEAQMEDPKGYPFKGDFIGKNYELALDIASSRIDAKESKKEESKPKTFLQRISDNYLIMGLCGICGLLGLGCIYLMAKKSEFH